MVGRVEFRCSTDYDGEGVALGFGNDIAGAMGSLFLAWMIGWRVYMIGRKVFASGERVFANASERGDREYGNGTEKPRRLVGREWTMTET